MLSPEFIFLGLGLDLLYVLWDSYDIEIGWIIQQISKSDIKFGSLFFMFYYVQSSKYMRELIRSYKVIDNLDLQCVRLAYKQNEDVSCLNFQASSIFCVSSVGVNIIYEFMNLLFKNINSILSELIPINKIKDIIPLMKSFINQPSDIVNQSIQGLLINQKLAVLDRFPQIRVVVRKDWNKSKVALITGGGSGHQPAHAGFIGQGMLTAAVCGDIFASPSVDAVFSAILAVTGQSGCLLIIKNYTGDRLNFGLAAEQARSLGYKVQCVIVGDDVSLQSQSHRRGIAGTLFVHKIAGYYSQQGYSLQQVTKIAKKVANSTFSMGLAIKQCHIFNKNKIDKLNENQAQLGLGIHGQHGVKVVNYTNANQLMKLASDSLYQKLTNKDKQYGLMLNNLGFVTPIQMNILLNAFTKTPLSKHIKYIIGPSLLMTALNMSGFSLSVIQLDQQITKALLSDVQPQAWSKVRPYVEPTYIKTQQNSKKIQFQPSENNKVKSIVEDIANTLINIQNQINSIDQKVGDGDTGSTLSGAAKTILKHSNQLPYGDLGKFLYAVGKIFSREVGGSSGVLLSILFTAASNSYEKNKKLQNALLDGLKQVESYGGASKGHRTMIDALQPAFTALYEGKNIEQVSKQARKGAQSTRNIHKTKFGRSAYIPQQNLKGIPDPGAQAMALVFQALSKSKLI